MGIFTAFYKFVESIYTKIIRLLRTRPFYYIGKTFSHGGVHFLFLVITLVACSYFYIKNSSSDIKPRNIALGVSWTNKCQAVTTDRGNLWIGDSIKNLKISLELNSKTTENETNGKYRNRIVMSFSGDGPSKLEGFRNIDALYVLYNDKKQDSIAVTLFGDPLVSDISYKVFSDSIFKPEGMPDYTTSYIDSSFANAWRQGKVIIIDAPDSTSSNTENRGTTLPPIIEGEPEVEMVRQYNGVRLAGYTTRYLQYYDHHDSIFVLKLMPAKFEYDEHWHSPRQNVVIYSDDIGVKSCDPYYYYYITFPSDRIAGTLDFSFKASDLTNNISGFNYTKDIYLQYAYVYPEPDVINNGYIRYFTKEKMDQIVKNHGVIIQAVDINALNRANNYAFLYSVLVGTGLAFIIDILIQLVKEIRNLNNRPKKV